MKISATEYHYLLRQDLTAFIQRSFYELNPQTLLLLSWYIEVIAAMLEACRLGKRRRLIITLPPRHLKSHCVSVAFVAWLLGFDPAAQIICASYGQDLSDKHARDCRTLMNSALYRRLFATRLGERTAVQDFATTQGGTRMATSIGGVLTGRGADWIIIDDPLKPGDALSEAARKAVNEWYDHTLLSRLNDKASGCIIIVMQRLHQDDLVGHVLEQEDWEVVSFPAIAEDNEVHVIETPFGRRQFLRREGEALHPEREPLRLLEKLRKEMGEYAFAAQFQQNPAPLGGALIKTAWLRYYEPHELPPRFSRQVLSWDTANKATELHDYSVCTVWGELDQRCYLLEVLRQRLEYPDLCRAVREMARRYPTATILIEDKASGTQLLQDLKAEYQYRLHGYVPPPGTDKTMRLNLQTVKFENGCVLLPRSARWLAEYVNELTSFPGSKFYDQVDSTTQALDYMSQPDEAKTWAMFGRRFPDFR